MRCTLTRREENVSSGNRNATIQRLVVGARSDGTLTALTGDYVNAVGWFGWNAFTEGPMQMLYACPNVKTVTRGAKINTPPMRPFRAPGFVEGTFGLECLLDELAAQLDIDPLELRRRNYADGRARQRQAVQRQEPGRVLPPRRAALGAPARGARQLDRDGQARRRHGLADLVRRRRPAELRLGARRRRRPRGRHHRAAGRRQRHEDGARADRGRGARPAARARDRSSPGDSARGPYATLSGGSSTTPSMGPATRAAAADAKRQLLELAAQRYDRDAASPQRRGRRWSSTPAARAGRVDEVLGLLGNGQILGTGARGPNPTGMDVLTFGIHVAEVAVDVETGEVTVDRIAAIHDIGRVINPLGASSQVEGGIIQGIGHTLSEERLLDPAHAARSSRARSTPTGCRRSPTCRRSSCEFVDEPDAQLTNLGAKGLGEPPIVPVAAAIANAIRDATGADVRSLPITREEMLKALREARERAGRTWSSCGRLASTSSTLASTACRSRAAPRSCRCCATGCSRPTRSSTCSTCCRAGSTARGSARRTTLAELEASDAIPDVAARGRAPRRVAAAAEHGHGRRQPAPGDALLVLAAEDAVPPPRRRHAASRPTASTASTRSSRNDFCASAHPSDLAAALVALGATLRTNRRELPVADLYRLPTEDDRRTTTLAAGRADPRARRAAGRRVDVPEGDGAQALVVPASSASPPCGAAARRRSRSPASRRSRGCSTGSLDDATPLPGNAYKVEIAAALVRRALAAVA